MILYYKYPKPYEPAEVSFLQWFFICLFINISTFSWMAYNWQKEATPVVECPPVELEVEVDGRFLEDQVSRFVDNADWFYQSVEQVASSLEMESNWLLAVMHSESKFDASVANLQGSGAIGLIQWMPVTAKEMGITVERLKGMNHLQQLGYVQQYYEMIIGRYGRVENLTEAYLAVLYPKALRHKDNYCYTLYEKGSKAYQLNKGLDFNRDGRVTIKDIDDRMKRKYRQAYFTEPSKMIVAL